MRYRLDYFPLMAVCACVLVAACDHESTEPGGGDAKSGEGDAGQVVCTADAKLCPDGSSVGRDPESDCEFFPCSEPVGCTDDAKVCPDGTVLSRDAKDDCKFPECPDEVLCTADAMECPDGSFVGRDPENGCEFAPCSDGCTNPETGKPDSPVNCLVDPCSVTQCDAFPEAHCEADYCGGCHAVFTDDEGNEVDCELVACTFDAKQCPDGSYVGRDPSNGCAWLPCP